MGSKVSCSGGSSGPAKPNILLFVADDLGWGDVGFHGSVCRTPNIDRLARFGVELDQFYVCPQCSPTRLSLLTGRYSSRFGVNAATNDPTMPLGTPTLASMLKDCGYQTLLSGKWHLGSDYEHGPNKYGFDHAYGNMTGACHPFDHTYRKGRLERTWHRNGQRLDQQGGHATDLIAEEAVRWLETQKRGEPWFAYIPFTAVHTPIGAPQAWIDAYGDVKFDDDPKIDESRRRYAAMVSHMDEAMGKIIASVEKMGEKENTLIAFLSDNGSFYPKVPGGEVYGGNPPLISYAVGTNKPFRGEKSTREAGGIRVPALVYWDERLSPKKINTPLSVTDLTPTLLHLSGCPSPDIPFDGRDIGPLVTDKNTLPESRIIYTRYEAGMNAFRQDDWKLVTLGESEWAREMMPGEDRSDQLFNIADDPYETTDLSDSQPDILARLQKLLAEEMARDERESQKIWGDSSELKK